MSNQVIVKFGAVKNAHPSYSEFSGFGYVIMEKEEAEEFVRKVRQEWAMIDNSLFVYGQPEIEIITPYDCSDKGRGIKHSPAKAARNWYKGL